MKEFFDLENCIDILAEQMRLSLTSDERTALVQELKKMADYTYPRLMSEEKALPFSYVQSETADREDIAKSTSDDEIQLILSNCPSLSDGHVAVPKIIKGES